VNLPCPFCGTPPGDAPAIETEYGAQVSCRGCSALGPVVVFERDGQDTHAEAIELWNKRTLGRAEGGAS